MNIRELRQKRKMTMKQLAEKTGCHIQQIYNIEHGRSLVPRKRAKLFAKALGVSALSIIIFIMNERERNFVLRQKSFIKSIK